ncbi:hypothetical protein GFL09_03065, partial [Pseudomonas stutzeri]|uniref:VCBS domain-containing protein n=1 Tax=Stutzerimonas stutzeri TaxID=316 RepID=UPI00190C204F
MATDNITDTVPSTAQNNSGRNFAGLDGGTLLRDGNNLIYTSANGETTVIPNFFNDPKAVFTAPGSSVALSSEILLANFPHLAAAPLPTSSGSDGSVAGSDAEIIVAHVREATGSIRLVRNNNETDLKPGDALLDGDIIDSNGDGKAKLEFVETEPQDTNKPVVTATIGANSSVELQHELIEQAGADTSTLTMDVRIGAVILENLDVSGARIFIRTPAGLMDGRGQNFGVHVNAANGETTVMALNSNVSALEGNSGIFIQSAGIVSRISLPGEAIVLQAGGIQDAQLGAPTPAQTSAISRLTEGPGATGAGADPGSSFTIASSTSSSAPGSSFGNTSFGSHSIAPFSGFNAGAPFSNSAATAPFSGPSPAPLPVTTPVFSSPLPAAPFAPISTSVTPLPPPAEQPQVITLIGGINTAKVTETDSPLNVGAALTSNKGSGQFQVQTQVAGSNGHGVFSIDANGVWTYSADANNALAAGVVYYDSFTALTVDGTPQTVTVTLNGTNDAPVISNTLGALVGNVSEAGPLDDGTVATGTLSATDSDAGATRTWSVQGTPSTTYGDLVLDATTGVWTYTLDNTLAATQALKEGEEVTQTYTARVTDDFGAYIDQVVTITITGSNDVPVV